MSTASTVDVATVASVAVDQGIDDPHARAPADQFVADVRTDEAQPTGDHADGGRQSRGSGASRDVRDRGVQRSVTWTMTSTNGWSPPASSTGGTGRRERCWRCWSRPISQPSTSDTLYLDAAGGSGATGSWLADRATTVLDDFEPIALQAAVHDHAGYRGVRADINHLPHAISHVRCCPVRHRALPPNESRSAGDRQRVRPRHQAGRSGVPDGAGRQAAVARSRRRDPHCSPIQPRRDARDGPRCRARSRSCNRVPTRSWSRPRR